MKNSYEYICSDCYRKIGKCNIIWIVMLFLYSSTFRWQVIFRMSNSSGLLFILGRILYFFNFKKNSIQIPLGTKIGYGLYIAHGGPVIVNKTAIIGNNCNISQFVTIGSNHEEAAIIGNNVYIGPNSCIIENVNVGDNVTIGAGSIVTKDIPTNATVAGNYAKVLNYNNPGRYVKNKYERVK